MRRKIRYLIAGFGTLLLIPVFVLGPYALRAQHVEADPSQGFVADFLPLCIAGVQTICPQRNGGHPARAAKRFRHQHSA
jgi:hypothetical protein